MVEIAAIWRGLCGDQESLSYCEFLAALLPPIEDVFEDACPEGQGKDMSSCSSCENLADSLQSSLEVGCQWSPLQPISLFLPLRKRERGTITPVNEDVPVLEVVQHMCAEHLRWVIVKYRKRGYAFFDYMDLNHELIKLCSKMTSCESSSAASQALAHLGKLPVGLLANCSGFCAFSSLTLDATFGQLLKILCGGINDQGCARVRRVPILDGMGDLVDVFSCNDILQLALRFPWPSAVLKSRSARKFDRRSTVIKASVFHEDTLMNALRIMDSKRLLICPVTSRELSGNMGGVVVSSVVSAADLKWVMCSGDFHVLDKSVSDFIAWRSGMEHAGLDRIMRMQRLKRFNVVSVDEGDSLYMLAQTLLKSKLQRIFLSSIELARIVGIVGTRDILIEVIDDLFDPEVIDCCFTDKR